MYKNFQNIKYFLIKKTEKELLFHLEKKQWKKAKWWFLSLEKLLK